jgi:hypothetical protein
MSTETTVRKMETVSPSVEELTQTLRAEHSAVVDGVKETLRRAMKAGDTLNQLRDLVPYGKWGPLLKRCGVAERTAQQYMQLATGRRQIEEALKTVPGTDLTLKQAARVAEGKSPKPVAKPPTAEAIGKIANSCWRSWRRQTPALRRRRSPTSRSG